VKRANIARLDREARAAAAGPRLERAGCSVDRADALRWQVAIAPGAAMAVYCPSTDTWRLDGGRIGYGIERLLEALRAQAKP